MGRPKELYAKAADVDRDMCDFHLIATPLGLDCRERMLADNPDGKRSNQLMGKGAVDYDGQASAKAGSE